MGQTTVIQRVLQRREPESLVTEEETISTLSVLLRVLPPPRAWIVVRGPTGAQVERWVAASLLEVDSIADEPEVLRRLAEDPAPIVITDSLALVRGIRERRLTRAPVLLFVAELDDAREREAGLAAGADEVIARRAVEREWHARIGAVRRIVELEAVLRTTLAENRRLSTTDDLTRVMSRRFFRKTFPREVSRAARSHRALALVLCDIDNFKKINDTYGHLGGDDVLKQFGPRLEGALRARIDWVARIGGEEFAIVLPETAPESATQTARRLRVWVAQTPFAVQGQLLRVTASFGVCGLDQLRSGDPGLAQRMLRAADVALYRSKHEGRDRVTVTPVDASV